MPRKSVTEARSTFSKTIRATTKGHSTIITRYGRPVAALVPINARDDTRRQQPLIGLFGSGRGLWGKSSVRMMRKLRDEWSQ